MLSKDMSLKSSVTWMMTFHSERRRHLWCKGRCAIRPCSIADLERLLVPSAIDCNGSNAHIHVELPRMLHFELNSKVAFAKTLLCYVSGIAGNLIKEQFHHK